MVGIVQANMFRLNEISSRREPTLAECKRFFCRLKEEYAVEYQLHGLDSLAIACVLPQVSSTHMFDLQLDAHSQSFR